MSIKGNCDSELARGTKLGDGVSNRTDSLLWGYQEWSSPRDKTDELPIILTWSITGWYRMPTCHA